MELMDFKVVTYIAYLVISVILTAWVGKTLHKNGRVFLVDAFHGNELLADSVNHLLIVGFYLINIGYVTLALTYRDEIVSLQETIEILSNKVGLVLVVLGIMHFFNLIVLTVLRGCGMHKEDGLINIPPIEPQGRIQPNFQ